MKFLCLVYQEEQKLAALPQREMDSLVGACMGWVEDLERGGHHILSAGLQSPRSAATVRVRDGVNRKVLQVQATLSDWGNMLFVKEARQFVLTARSLFSVIPQWLRSWSTL